MNLKTFIQESYTCCLNATSITTGTQGYVQNAYAALAEDSEDEDDDVQTVITQMAALTTQSQLTASTAAETNALVTAQLTSLRQINRQCNNSLRHLHQHATQRISIQCQPHHPCSNSPSQILARSSLQDLESVEGKEDMDKASVLTPDARGVHHLIILSDAVARGAYPPLEAVVEALMCCSHNNIRHVTWRQCILSSSNGTQTGTFVSLAVLMLKMDIRPKHAQPPGDAQITKRDTPTLTLGSIMWRDVMRAPRQCTSHSYQPCDGVVQSI